MAKAAAKGAKAVASKILGKTGGTKAATVPKCFLAGTPILLADGTTKNIEDIQVGDKVLSTNPTTGETNAQPVTELLPSEGDKKLNELTITTADGNQKITATAEHPFWIPKANAWINAADLKPGTTLSTPNGTTAKIANNRPYTDHVRTYNFAVANLHTYYALAGATPLLVHNTCGGGGEAAEEAAQESSDLVRVGRWMNLDEYGKMTRTGMVQEGKGGMTYVARPATPEAYGRQAAPGTGYAAFDVPANSLYPGGEPGWAILSGPRGLPARLAARKGLPIPQLPAALNISDWMGPK
ncbi:polymorphic toxin-type HINT domain-containing protein [Streptomyces sp. NPDC102274]|uniref:TreTu family toxin n=1 Tax=Streptomyces sp. NPDC102274 TaxID=3366151 RepID=UPI00382F5B30